MNPYIKATSLAILIATFLTFCITYIIAYLNPSKTVLVHINYYGEAGIELLFLAIGLPLILWYSIEEIKRLKLEV